jgi:hypothetical protein
VTIRAVLALAAALLVVPGLALADPAAWRVAGKNGGEVVLLGSVHALRASDYPLPPVVDELYAHADVLVMELDLDDLDPKTEQATLLAVARLPPAQHLPDVLDASVYGLAERRAGELGIDLGLLDRFEPWLVAITMLDAGLEKLGFVSSLGLERYFIAKAAKDHKEIVGLESLDKQLGIFDQLTPREQQSLLEQTLQELDGASETMTQLATAWRDGKLETLTDTLLADFGDFPMLYDALVTERNSAWVESLERMLDDGHRYLVVVGALHLVGNGSVIEKLGERGHRVERLGKATSAAGSRG